MYTSVLVMTRRLLNYFSGGVHLANNQFFCVTGWTDFQSIKMTVDQLKKSTSAVPTPADGSKNILTQKVSKFYSCVKKWPTKNVWENNKRKNLHALIVPIELHQLVEGSTGPTYCWLHFQMEKILLDILQPICSLVSVLPSNVVITSDRS